MPKYKEIDGVRYQVVNNTFLGSNLIPVDAGGSLPEVDGSDNGKVLTVVAGEWDAAAVPKELPSVAGNAGKVLTVNSGATGTEWKDAPSGLPAVTIDDAGDVLTVNASGEWEPAAPSGGGSSLPAVTADDVGKYLVVVPTYEPTTVNVPQQTVTVVNEPVPLTDTTPFAGGVYRATINGSVFTASESAAEIYVETDDTSYLFIYDSGTNLYSFIATDATGVDPVPGDYTVKLETVTEAGAAWGLSSNAPNG